MSSTLIYVQRGCDLKVVWLSVGRGGAFIGENCMSIGGMREVIALGIIAMFEHGGLKNRKSVSHWRGIF